MLWAISILSFLFFVGGRVHIRIFFFAAIILGIKAHRVTGSEIDFYMLAIVGLGYVLCAIAPSRAAIARSIKESEDPLSLIKK